MTAIDISLKNLDLEFFFQGRPFKVPTPKLSQLLDLLVYFARTQVTT